MPYCKYTVTQQNRNSFKYANTVANNKKTDLDIFKDSHDFYSNKYKNLTAFINILCGHLGYVFISCKKQKQPLDLTVTAA